ncbi:hypothetical protein P3T24_000614 [Paraburkholderia sp. GAS33]|jgi:hypothetical protein|uniref:hypothetical protein n=1 Tax=Paraburkholderia sp. GAS33 TaxID=3035130 RepID=UPI003D21C98E
MKLTYPLLLNAKPQVKPYKLTDRDSMYLYVSIKDTNTWKFDYRLDGNACRTLWGTSPIYRFMTHESCEAMPPRWSRPASIPGLMKADFSSKPSPITRTRVGLSVRNS